jgi:DNA-binding NtrC family response regulator
MPPPRLLVVDDDPHVVRLVMRFGENAGFEVSSCGGGREALDRLARERADVAVVDLRMPDLGGLEVLRAIREADPDCQTILMSGQATIDSALEAAKLGAIDYLTKPFDLERLQALLASVKDEVARRRRVLAAERELTKDLEFCGMIGRSPVMRELFGIIRRFAPHVRTALISGETGVGKELVARALHQTGPRRAKRFVAINCSAIPDTLFESELFGHVKGAFTGASENKIGLFEHADGGTVFLDEIGELPQSAQAKLLRVLETGEVQRVGAVEARRVDLRVIAATNRDLRIEVDEGRFRPDLYYRLTVVEIEVPPLRERREDIPRLAACFLTTHAQRYRKAITGFDPSALRALVDHRWPGNVRELDHAVERAVLMAQGNVVHTADLGLRSAVAVGEHLDEMSLEDVEALLIRKAMARHGNVTLAAKALGLSRSALYRRLERYKLA